MRLHEERVLEWTNQMRKQYNLGEPLTELPPDLTVEQWLEDGRTVTSHCPMAVALCQSSCGVGSFTLGGKTVHAPGFVAQFQADHDWRVIKAARDAGYIPGTL